MKHIRVLSQKSTGLHPLLAEANILSIEDAVLGVGGFGTVHRAVTFDGHWVPPQIIKIFTAPNDIAQRCLQTIQELQTRLSVKNKELLAIGTTLLDEYPALQSVPQLSFVGELDGRALIGYSANDLTSCAFESFCTILEDLTKLQQFQVLPLTSKLQLALHLVTSLRLLSNELQFIHADIKPDSVFINLTELRCAIIDYDCGAIVRKPFDSPLTFGTMQEWLAPEIIRQLKPAKLRSPVQVTLSADVWSANIAIHYLLFTFSPYFFLTEISDRSMRMYSERFKWPDIDISFPYFNQASAKHHAWYSQLLKTSVPVEIVKEFEFTFNLGYFDPSWRTPYRQWEAILKAFDIKEKHRPRLQKHRSNLRVFLCHSSADKPAVRQIYRRLKYDGFVPWLDEEDLVPGQNWRREISKAVRTCHVVVVCLSASSVTKEGYIQKEIKIALDVEEEKPEGTIFIIPVRLEDGVNVPERLAKWQWMNLFQEGDYEQLIRALDIRADTIHPSSSFGNQIRFE